MIAAASLDSAQAMNPTLLFVGDAGIYLGIGTIKRRQPLECPMTAGDWLLGVFGWPLLFMQLDAGARARR
ncbi:MAG: hypothetical protein ACXU89_02690 [Xanthobacteraceae bacterium]